MILDVSHLAGLMPLSQAWFPSSILHSSLSTWEDWVDRLRGKKLEASRNILSFSHIFQGNFYHRVVDKVILNTNSALFSIWLFSFLVSSLSREPLSREGMNGRIQTPKSHLQDQTGFWLMTWLGRKIMTKEGSILHDDSTGSRGSSEISCREGRSGETSDGKKKAVSMGFEVMSEGSPEG